MGLFDIFKSRFQKVDSFREKKENEFADLMDKIGKNETFKKVENSAADELVALALQAGITLAESQTGQNITVSDEQMNKIADKGGDFLVRIINSFAKLFQRQLRK